MSPEQSQHEKELLVRLRDGDEKAFRQIYDLYSVRLSAKLVRLLKSEELAKDILQDLFLKIWEIRQTIDPQKSFAAFLFTIAGNMARNAFQQTLREARMREQSTSNEGYLHIEEQIYQQEDQEMLEKALQKLPQKQRQVFILHKIEGKSYLEISQELQISISAINHHIQNATKKLVQLLPPKTDLFIIVLLYALMQP